MKSETPPFYDIARWGDACDELETLLRLVFHNRSDEAKEMVDRMVEQYQDYETRLYGEAKDAMDSYDQRQP